mmetsp:Transcript_19607/g.30724  ORF Transcript_19607/g.30724 Transcript_19607/m.30724 type:complete len:242 (-) Transcript_19607:733-1458(-)
MIGMCSIIARRTRHCLSSARWTMAGIRACSSKSTLMTLSTALSFEMMFNRTSENSSCNKRRKRSTRWAFVFSFPQIGARSIMTLDKATLTCSEGSTTRSLIEGITSDIANSEETREQTATTFPEAAVRTSGSTSPTNFVNAVTKCFSVICGPKASHISVSLSATMKRTRQASSAAHPNNVSRILCAIFSSSFNILAISMALGTVNKRTESWESLERETNLGEINLRKGSLGVREASFAICV